MTYTAPVFLLAFLPAVMILYHFVHQKYRWIVLLIASYAFYFIVSGKLLVFLLISTLSIHYTGLWLESLQNERDCILAAAEKTEKKAIKHSYQTRMRWVVTIASLFNIALLLVIKYSAFFATNFNTLMELINVNITVKVPSFALPMGISFYTLQTVAYVTDVYRGKIKADRNIFRLALFMGFFPEIMEGPICRYSDTALQLWAGDDIKYRNLIDGFERILYGLIKEFVIADRLNAFIKEVFANYSKYDGGVIVLAVLSYTCQLYMDFSGTMDIVIGAAQIFGVKLPENFKQPFFSKSITEFWKRWHITLGTWFQDYIFYPLSLSKPLKKLTSKARKHLGNHYGPLTSGAIALFCVWSCNGLWHGSGWTFLFYGMYHFVMILGGNLIEPPGRWLTKKLHIDRAKMPYKIFQMLRSFVLINIGEMFFRAPDLTTGFGMFKKMFTEFTFASFRNGSVLKLGMDKYDFIIAGITIALIFVVSVFKEKGVDLREKIAGKKMWIRWLIYYAMIFFIIIYGAYGPGYTAVDPMYAGF